MTFQKLNGWPVLATANSSQSKKTTPRGELDRRWRNRITRNRKSIEDSWNISTPKMDELCADTLEGLVDGEAHHFPFLQDAWSESGLGPEDGYNVTLSTTGGPIATRGHYLTVVTSLIYDAKLIDFTTAPDGGRWSLSFWYENGGTWERHVVRNDGTGFINGVADASAGGGVVVSSGAVSFPTAAKIADLTIFYFYLCDSFCVSDYAWVTGLGLTYRYSFTGGTYVDDVQGATGSPINSVGTGRGQVGAGLLFNGISHAMTLDDAVLASLDGQGAASFAFWVNPASLPGGGERHVILESLFGGSSTIKVRIDFDSAGMLKVESWLSVADDTSLEATTALAVDALQFVVVVLNPTTQELSIYLDAVLIGYDDGGWSGSTWSGGVRAGESILGRDVANVLPTHFDGVLDEFRLFDGALSADNVEEIYLAERWRRRFPGPRFQAASPSLDLYGDINGSKDPVAVAGEITGEDYLQHGPGPGDSEWTNNARKLNYLLERVKREPSKDRFPDAAAAWALHQIFNQSNQVNSTIRPQAGDAFLSAGGVHSFDDRDRIGPYGFPLSAYRFDGANHYESSIQSLTNILHGAAGFALAGWLKLTATGAIQVLFDLPIAGAGASRAIFGVDAANKFFAAGRSAVADVLQTGLSTTVLAAGEWHFLSADVDYENDEIRIYVDGKLETTQAAVFSEDRGTNESSTPVRVGNASDDTRDMQGETPGVCLYARTLTAGEHRAMFNAGKLGIFT